MLENVEKGLTFISHHRYNSEIAFCQNTDASDIKHDCVKMPLRKLY